MSRPVPRVDVAVIGGGPAGLSAATAAAEAGASVLVLEAGAEPGGLFALQSQPLTDGLDLYGGATGPDYAGTLAEAARAAGAALMTSAPVWDVDPDLTISYAQDGIAGRVSARLLVVSTGSDDGVTVFPGWTMPGVLLLREAQRLMMQGRALPGRRALVVGGGDAALIVQQNLRGAGAEVVAVVDEQPSMSAAQRLLDEARAADVRLLPSHRVVAASGCNGVERVTVAPVGDVTDGATEIDVDLVVLATHRVPDFRAAALLGVTAACEDGLGGWVPALDGGLRSSDARVFVAGDASGVGSGAVSICQGRLAGLHAAADLGFRRPDFDAQVAEAVRLVAERRAGRGRRVAARAGARASQPGSVVACRCTGATLGDVAAAIQSGNGTAAEVRRLSGTGMGVCQGRYCDELVSAVIAERTGRSAREIGRPRVRPPLLPISLQTLADLDDRRQDGLLE